MKRDQATGLESEHPAQPRLPAHIASAVRTRRLVGSGSATPRGRLLAVARTMAIADEETTVDQQGGHGPTGRDHQTADGRTGHETDREDHIGERIALGQQVERTENLHRGGTGQGPRDDRHGAVEDDDAQHGDQ